MFEVVVVVVARHGHHAVLISPFLVAPKAPSPLLLFNHIDSLDSASLHWDLRIGPAVLCA